MMIQAIRFGSEARKFGLQQGDEIKAVVVANERMSPYWLTIPAFLLLGLIWFAQRRRQRAERGLPPGVTARA